VPLDLAEDLSGAIYSKYFLRRCGLCPGLVVNRRPAKSANTGKWLSHVGALWQLTQMPGVRAVALRVLLGTAQRARLRRLGEMHPRAHRAQLLDHEPLLGRRLKRCFQLLAAKPC